MTRRTVLALASAVVLLAMTVLWQDRAHDLAEAAQPGATWSSAMLWHPSLPEAGDALSTHVNQIPAACTVDVDPAATTNGASPEGVVYAFLVTWACPPGANVADGVWQSALVWRPTLPETGDAVAALTNQIDAGCTVDVDRVMAANGAGPEGPVYAFAVTWGCPQGSGG